MTSSPSNGGSGPPPPEKTAESEVLPETDRDPQKEEERLRALLEQGEDARTYTSLGRVLRRQDRLVEARGAFEKAIDLDSARLAAYLGLAGVMIDLDQPEQAFELLSKGTTQAHRLRDEGTSKASLFYFLGEMQLQLHELAEALGFFKRAGEEAPDDAGMQGRIGDALQDAGHLAESEAFYLRAMELDPQPAHTYNRLGIARRKQGKFAEALDTFLKAVKFHPRDENLLFNMARCLYEKGELQAAGRLLERLTKMAPELSEAGLLAEAVKKKMAGARPRAAEGSGEKGEEKKQGAEPEGAVAAVLED